ncbi:recombinase family protein [Caulobacter sp. UC70_42]|uniref:recombinase family protein n=1 Tax=Caulobacter sp. UC70_42 TaxID=3374551 RepID=UPI003756C504
MSTKAYSYARWSSGRQREGHTLKRQIEAAQKYAADHDLDLDTSMVDDAVSAYRGKNRLKGALGRFKEAIEKGQVPVGSYFLIDSYDRFSREKTNIAVQSLLEIVNAGVNVVTLSNQYVFSRDGDAVTNLVLATVEFERAHRESAEKGRKVKAAHDESKDVARKGGRKWTPLAPAWMNVTVVGTGKARTHLYEPIPERVDLVQEMFDKFEAGMTTRSIARDFNTRNPPVPTNYQYQRMTKPQRLNGDDRVRKDKGEWSSDTITTVLANRAVLGEHQPMTTDPNSPRGRRTDGEPIPGYYGNPIIDEAQFLRVQAMLAARKRAPRVRGSLEYNNLFIQLGVCGECGKTFSLHSNWNSDPRKRTPRLRCVAAQSGGRCTNKGRLPYPPLEAAFLSHVTDFEIPNAKPTLNADQQELALARLKHDDLEARCRKMSLQLFEADSVNPFLRQTLDEKTAEVGALAERIKELEALVGSASTMPKPTDHVANIVSLRERLDAAEGEAKYALRANIAHNIRAVVEKMIFNPDGSVMVFVKGLEAFYLFKDGEFIGKADDKVMSLVRRAAEAGGHKPEDVIRRTKRGSTEFILGPAKRKTA